MIKKIFFVFLFSLSILCAYAQHVPGTWKILPLAGTNFEYVQDTPSKVYYLTGSSLYSFDGEETVYYSPGTKISDSGIKFLKYNGDEKYLLLAYSNGNIDLIYDNGKIVNLPEIKNATLTTSKGINNVSFGKNRIYVATTFGLVVYDDKNHHVVESGIYNQSVPFAFEMGDNLMIVHDGKLKFAPLNDRHNSLDKFVEISPAALSSDNIYAVSSNEYITLADKKVVKVAVDFNNKTFSSSPVVNLSSGKNLGKYKNGFFVADANGFQLINNDGSFNTFSSYDPGFSSQTISFWNSPASVWSANANGIGNYDLSGENYVILHSRYFPEASKQTLPWFYINHPDKNEVYFNRELSSRIFDPYSSPNNFGEVYVESYNWDNGKITDHTPYVNGNNTYGGVGRVLFAPGDPSTLFLCNNLLGFQVVKDNSVVYSYNQNNSPLFTVSSSARVYDAAFDNNGNLWFSLWRTSTTSPTSKLSTMKVLPKASVDMLLAGQYDELTKLENNQYTYWFDPDHKSGYVGECDGKLLFHSKSNKGLHYTGGWGFYVDGIDTKGTANLADDTFQTYSGFKDASDGTISSPRHIIWMEEDKNGWIWVATFTGIFIIKDVDQICDGSSNYITAVRPKVARNDGTDYADYLLSSDVCTSISVDANNRKWIATFSSGLYYVSEDGTEILAEFNKENSPLVSNNISMVACNPYNNDVLIGTPEGLYVYSSDSAPAQDDFSEVYAFPNPVRPDYTGWITINGLMDNSVITITDAQGQQIWKGNSQGGMAVWDGCDMSGNRVRSGVYMVFAHSNAAGSASGAVTKIVVIN